MTDKNDDLELFRQAMQGVKPLGKSLAETGKIKPKPVARQRAADEAQVMIDAMADPRFPEDLETGEEMIYQHPGLQHATMRKLRRGQYAIESQLDLHGYRVKEAKAALAGFLAECSNRGIRCVRIVHGKGNRSPGKKPVIKSHLGFWLRHRNDVLAFCSARPVDGGTGALYVLLKKNG